MNLLESAAALEDLLREDYPRAVVSFNADRKVFVALTGDEPGIRTEFEPPPTPIAFPHLHAIARSLIDSWKMQESQNPYA